MTVGVLVTVKMDVHLLGSNVNVLEEHATSIHRAPDSK
jgi:hypothetical protein